MREKLKMALCLVLIILILLPGLIGSADLKTPDVGVVTDNHPVVSLNNDQNETIVDTVVTELDDLNKDNIEKISNELNEINNSIEENVSDDNEKQNNCDLIVPIGTVYEKKAIYNGDAFSYYDNEELNLRAEELKKITLIENLTESAYEIALAHSDGSFTFCDTANSIDEAIEKANKIPVSCGENDDYVLPTVIAKDGQVVYSTLYMGRVWKHINGKPDPTFNNNTTVYQNEDLGYSFTNNYINQGHVDDVPVIEINDKAAKIQVAGFTGWVKTSGSGENYDLVLYPINQVSNPSYYMNKNGILYHFISANFTSAEKRGYENAIGVAPSYMKENVRYLSYDGKYFYDGTSIVEGLTCLINDLKQKTNTNSINPNSPNYNYFQFLPFRTKTCYTAADLNDFISTKTSSTSKLRGIGDSLILAQNKYGVNALLALGVAINESGWGESDIAKEKNNIFGLNAVDSSPGLSADAFPSISACINDFAKNWISSGYADPSDSRFFGGCLGNKEYGLNVRYASDPYWSEKATKYAFMADLYLGGGSLEKLRDYDGEQLFLYKNTGIIKDLSGNKLYDVVSDFNSYGTFIGTVGVATSGKIIDKFGYSCYEIQPDISSPLYNGSVIASFPGEFDWNAYGYVPSGIVTFINVNRNYVADYNVNFKNTWLFTPNGKKYYYKSDGNLGKGFVSINGKTYYFNKNTGELVLGWISENNKKYYGSGDGSLKIGIGAINGKTYYFNADGEMMTGIQNVNGSLFCFNNLTGEAITGWYKENDKNYFFDLSGKAITGWINYQGKKYYLFVNGNFPGECSYIEGNWYYFLDKGELRVGWMNRGGQRYYIKEDGRLASGSYKINNQWYYFNSNGSLRTGWIRINGELYYLNENGIMQSGWQIINGSKYYFKPSGALVNYNSKIGTQWYYFESDGRLKTGWQIIGNKKYYLNSNGIMVSGTYKIENQWYYFYSSGELRTGWMIIGENKYYLDSNGIMVSGWYTIDGIKYFFDASGKLIN